MCHKVRLYRGFGPCADINSSTGTRVPLRRSCAGLVVLAQGVTRGVPRAGGRSNRATPWAEMGESHWAVSNSPSPIGWPQVGPPWSSGLVPALLLAQI